jgi:Uma2 family endonuclease
MLLPESLYTAEEYLRLERQAEYKSEFINGEIIAMGGASPAHIVISMNLAGILYNQLRRRPCMSFNNDMKVRVTETGLYAYPDLSALCGKPQFADDAADVLLNPSVVIEILSPSTESYDRGAKSAHYRRLGSLEEYVLISQDGPRLEHYRRQPSGQWL